MYVSACSAPASSPVVTWNDSAANRGPASGGARVVAVADPQRERAEALAAECGAGAVAGVEDLFSEGLDCVYICIPPWRHGHPEDVAIAAGLPMFVETPLAADLSTAEALAGRIRAAGLLAVVGSQWRYLDTL